MTARNSLLKWDQETHSWNGKWKFTHEITTENSLVKSQLKIHLWITTPNSFVNSQKTFINYYPKLTREITIKNSLVKLQSNYHLWNTYWKFTCESLLKIRSWYHQNITREISTKNSLVKFLLKYTCEIVEIAIKIHSWTVKNVLTQNSHVKN